jgi:chemotaxis protein CheC
MVGAMYELLQAGAKEATGALARLVGDPPPPVTIGAVQTLSASESRAKLGDGEVVGVGFGVGGAVDGALLMICQREEALRLVGLLMVGHSGEQVDAHARSALSEVGNILASAFLNQIANALGSSVLPTPPHISVGTVAHVVEELTAEVETQRGGLDRWVLIGAELQVDDRRLHFDLVLVPTADALARLES